MIHTVTSIIILMVLLIGGFFCFDLLLRRSQRYWTQTDQRKIDTARARSTALLETAPVAVMITDVDGLVVEWNPAAVNIFGYTRADALGKNVSNLIIPEAFRARHIAGMERFKHNRAQSGNVLDKRLRVVCLRKSGEEFDAEMTVARIPFPYPTEPMFCAYIRDLTQAAIPTSSLV